MIFKVFGTLYGDVEHPVAICIMGASDEDDAKRMAMAFEPRMKLTAVEAVRVERGVFGAFYMGVVDKTRTEAAKTSHAEAAKTSHA